MSKPWSQIKHKTPYDPLTIPMGCECGYKFTVPAIAVESDSDIDCPMCGSLRTRTNP